jgi:dipicolinate synthase subunit A
VHNRLYYLYYIHKGQPPFINCIIRPPEGEGKALLRKKFSIIGGDMRNVYLADLLKKDYQYVEIYGFERSGKPWALKDTPLDFVLEGSRVVVGGIPLLKDNGFLNMPLSKEKLCFSELLEKIPEGAHLIAGKINDAVRKQLEQKKVKCTDLLDREEMAVLNAVPTAEGAVGILLQEMPKTLLGSRILVVGYGRIGKNLTKLLHGFGAEVWAAARKYSDIAWIEAQGFKPVPMHQLARYVSDMDAIVNTVPVPIITRDILEKIRTNCFLLDLASSPGGVDFKGAEAYGIKVRWALSLPGKVAPLTAGDIIRRTIYNILEEEGVFCHDS